MMIIAEHSRDLPGTVGRPRVLVVIELDIVEADNQSVYVNERPNVP
jgi:hypothetical protein